MSKKIFTIALTWEVCGELNVEAETLEQAIELALSDEMFLPDDAEYVDGSLEADKEMSEILTNYNTEEGNKIR